jgi:muramoyltetrapeptide carboxypeptidase
MSKGSRSLPSAPRKIRSRKPSALKPGAILGVIAPASPADGAKWVAGLKELKRLKYGFSIVDDPSSGPDGYFAAREEERRAEFLEFTNSRGVNGLIAVRGGYGSNYILDGLSDRSLQTPKCLIGFSDITTLQIFLWEKCGWVTIHGPMVAAGLDAGPGVHGGYDEESFLAAIRKTESGWYIPMQGETIRTGEANGTLLGGCLTLVETTLGTPWELGTRGAILILEDRGMRPWQVDRALMHLKQAGKFDGIRGIVLGDFPECEPPMAGSPTVRDVCTRILGALDVPVVFGAPVGHTQRPMLTLPLGVKARLSAKGEGVLEILEPAVVP